LEWELPVGTSLVVLRGVQCGWRGLVVAVMVVMVVRAEGHPCACSGVPIPAH
jgi:hypothetical protein